MVGPELKDASSRHQYHSLAEKKQRAPAIEVDSLTKSYGSHEAVRGISFSVARGEIFGFLGPNGAGKTTTVEILEGYRTRSSGRVSVLGFDPQERPAELRASIGIVLQRCGFYRHLSIREALEHWADLYPAPRPVDEVLGLVALEDVQNKRTRALSGGQLRRLDLALALIGDPELIFLDEPTTGFDPEARRNAWKAILNLKRLGKTVFLTTHYLDEAQALADRVAIIKHGKILIAGPPDELIAQSAPYEISYCNRGSTPIKCTTDNPTLILNQLTSDALARDERLEDLKVSRPTLEDVYLEMINNVEGDRD